MGLSAPSGFTGLFFLYFTGVGGNYAVKHPLLGGLMFNRTLLAALLAATSSAWANGAVVEVSGRTGGRVAPLQEGVIRLVSEDLRLQVLDLLSYRVSADYTLSNPGPPKRLDYGVPVDIEEQRLEPGPKAPAPLAELRAAALKFSRGVRITLAGKSVGCRWVPDEKPRNKDAVVSGWCVTALTIPQGDAVHLGLTYDAELSATDTLAFPVTRSPRVLKYPLAPASTWAGSTTHLRISVLPGPYAQWRPPTEMAKHVSGAWRWELAEADLKALGSLELSFTDPWTEALLAGPPVTMTASSTLPPEGPVNYDADLAADGHAETAWCVGAKEHPVGEWLELRADRPHFMHCFARELWLQPGYAKSEKLYLGNGRAKRLKLAACGTGEPLAEVDVDLTRPMKEGVTLDLPEAAQLNLRYYSDRPDRDCLRVELLEVAPGKASADTCVSELKLQFECLEF